ADGGANWKLACNGLANGVVWSLVLVAGSPSTLFAATYDGIFRSTDGGSSWTPVSSGLRSRFVVSLAVDPNSGTLFAGTAAGIFKSADGGAHWGSVGHGLTNQFVSVLAMHPQSPGILYAGTNGGVFKTADGAKTWQQVRLVPSEAAAPRSRVAGGAAQPRPGTATSAVATAKPPAGETRSAEIRETSSSILAGSSEA